VKITADTITAAQILECEPSAYECLTCLGVSRIRDGETGDLRRCLDCGGSGQRPDARARCAEIFNAKLTATITDAQIRELRDLVSMSPSALQTPAGVDRVTYRTQVLNYCERALQSRIYKGARARIADIINARSDK
jgi:hypothetical protein